MLLFTSTLAEVSSPIKLAGKQVGWVRVGKSLSHFNDGIAKNRQNGILFTLIGIVLSTLLAALAGRYFTRRLDAIQTVADGIKAGQSDLRVVLPGVPSITSRHVTDARPPASGSAAPTRCASMAALPQSSPIGLRYSLPLNALPSVFLIFYRSIKA